jgi:hypothetical protein
MELLVIFWSRRPALVRHHLLYSYRSLWSSGRITPAAHWSGWGERTAGAYRSRHLACRHPARLQDTERRSCSGFRWWRPELDTFNDTSAVRPVNRCNYRNENSCNYWNENNVLINAHGENNENVPEIFKPMSVTNVKKRLMLCKLRRAAEIEKLRTFFKTMSTTIYL